MGKRLFVDNAVSALAVNLGTNDTALELPVGGAAIFPEIVTEGDYYCLTLIGMDANGNENSWEIVRVTARNGDVLTVQRGQEGTAAKAWTGGTRVELRLTAKALSGFATESDVINLTSNKLNTDGGVMTGPILFTVELDLGNFGTTATVDWSKSHSQRATLTTNCTIAFTPPAGVFRGSLKLINSAAVARAVTWPAGIKYLGSVAPQVPDAKIGAIAIYAVYWDGATWFLSGGRYG